MSKKQFFNNPEQFKYRGRLYTAQSTIRIRGKLYFVVEEWGTRYKAFDKSVQEMRSIRIRKAGIKREMKLIQLAKMQNNNIPHVYDHWRDAQYEYLVQEWLEGHDLRHYLRLHAIHPNHF
ncbi:MAG TPA: hypothetical protein VKY19_06370 [Ktedonosporobacter sp.]|jgi:serine/threonine protein kinase|nr:hypothetical protein [Ktedonosporobacter sp.]